MTFRHPLKLAILSTFLLVCRAQPAESLSVLLQKGIFAEETEGNLDAAIQIYQKIADESEANRSVVAQAQYRLGMCRLKQGKKEESAAAFRKLIDQFADAAELVAKGKERLTELGQPAAAVSVRRIWSGTNMLTGSFSPDGRYLAFIDQVTGNLAIRELKTGLDRNLTKDGSKGKPGQYAESCAFSADGRAIAYTWHGTNDSYDLRVLSLDDTKSRVLLNTGTNGWIKVQDWSPDGKSIAVYDAQGGDDNWESAISLVNVADGAVQKIVTKKGQSGDLRFSPDGDFLAYHVARNSRRGPQGRWTNDIYVIDVRNRSKKLVVEYSANDQFLGWSSRGSEILFTSERRGPVDLWSIQVAGGEVQHVPRLLKTGLGDIEPIALTRSGAFYYSSAVSESKALYTAPVDFDAGKLLSAPKLVQTIERPRRMASDKLVASPSGRFLFFCSGSEKPAAYVLDVESGMRREIETSRAWADRIGWWWGASDNASLFAISVGPPLTTNETGFATGMLGFGIYKVSTQTGEMAPVALNGPEVRQMPDDPIRFRATPDFLAFGRLHLKPEKFVLVKHDLKSGRETEHEIPGMSSERFGISVASHPHGNKATLLPDGRSFLFTRKNAAGNLNIVIWHDLLTGTQKELLTSKSVGIWDNAFGLSSLVFLVNTDDRERLVFTAYSLENSQLHRSHQVTVPEGFDHQGVNWVGPYLLLTRKADRGNEAADELWTLSVRTGELKNLALQIPNARLWAVHPNGTRLMIQSDSPASREIWVMENFLPPVAAAK